MSLGKISFNCLLFNLFEMRQRIIQIAHVTLLKSMFSMAYEIFFQEFFHDWRSLILYPRNAVFASPNIGLHQKIVWTICRYPSRSCSFLIFDATVMPTSCISMCWMSLLQSSAFALLLKNAFAFWHD